MLVLGAPGKVGLAQTPAGASPNALRLTVRPREMATATHTAQAGQFQLGLMSGYVPKQCVGGRRCPLILYSNAPDELLIHIADKYGMIVASIGGILHDVAALDQSMKEALRTFAIDPDKIAIAGGSATGETTVNYAAQNVDVFTRTITYTQHGGEPPVKTPSQTNEYYISGGLLENTAYVPAAQLLRDRGYPVKYTLQFRPHGHEYEDFDFIGHWLQESWAIPNPAARPVPYTFGDPPLLTPERMDQMIVFWARLMKEPDSIRTTARRALVREVVLPIGKERISTLMVDMSALAAQCPSVAAAFKAAGLTPKEHDAYRAALASAHIVGVNRRPEVLFPVAATSAVAKNVAFIHAYPDAYEALMATGMWQTP